MFFSPKESLKIRRVSYCTCTFLSFQKFRKYFWLYSCIGKATKLYSWIGRCACLKDMFFVLKYFLREKVKMHHNVRQTGMMICGLVVDHLKDNIILGGIRSKYLWTLSKKNQKVELLIFPLVEKKWIGWAQTVCRYLLTLS